MHQVTFGNSQFFLDRIRCPNSKDSALYGLLLEAGHQQATGKILGLPLANQFGFALHFGRSPAHSLSGTLARGKESCSVMLSQAMDSLILG